MRKKGASHVEVIFSFVLFTSFIIFMFIVFKPLQIFSKTTTDLDATEDAILKNISNDLSVISMKIYDPVTESCFSVKNLLDDSLRLIVKNESGEIVNASRSGGNIYFEKSGDFYNLYYSDELNEQGSPSFCYSLVNGDYKTGFVKTYKIVSYSKLVALKNKYNQDYEQLKQEFGLGSDFYIIIRNSPEINFVLAKEKPRGVEILAEDFAVSILKPNADLNHDIMSVQVWG